MNPLLFLVPIGFLATLLFRRGGADISVRVPPKGDRQAALRRGIASVGGVTDAWIRFLEQTCYRETGGSWSPKSHNKTQSEVDASIIVAERVGTLEGIDFDSSKWRQGSKGLFQFLGPVIAVEGADTDGDHSRLRFPKSMIDGDMGYDPGIAIAAAFDYAKGLMNWDNFDGSWASLNVGWKNPSNMGKAASIEKSAESMEARAEKLGWPRGWAYDPVDPIPDRTATENAAFAKAAKTAYYA